MPSSKKNMVYRRLPKQDRVLGCNIPGLVHHYLLPGMGTVPWIVNSEIYPLKYRGIGGGIAAVANWSSNLVVSETFLTLTDHLGSSGTFLLFAGFSLIGLVSIFLLVPETKGLQFSEVEKLLEKGYSPFKKSSKKVKKEKDGHSS
ncbi:UNVERIFIED_CONTAM: Inositol transporter 4 [Sesamum radiatum]|uniref:Inositol transporter 4 n=1 Tax=Sesamum radiatum TaxID=300843 RepID=A0AAW2P8W9_SESRA